MAQTPSVILPVGSKMLEFNFPDTQGNIAASSIIPRRSSFFTEKLSPGPRAVKGMPALPITMPSRTAVITAETGDWSNPRTVSPRNAEARIQIYVQQHRRCGAGEQ